MHNMHVFNKSKYNRYCCLRKVQEKDIIEVRKKLAIRRNVSCEQEDI